MAQLNKVYLMGNLTRDPELRHTPNGAAVTDLGLAVNRSVKSKDGEWRDEVTFIDVTVWNRQAETCVEYLKKGRPVHVEGFLKMDQWEDKTTGEKKSKIKVEAERVQFLGGRDGAGSGSSSDEDFSPSPQREPAPRRSSPEQPRNQGGGGPSRGYSPPNNAPPSRRPPPPPVESDGDEDDIPF